jgi:transposase
MRDRELYEKMLGLQPPWSVEKIVLSIPGKSVEVSLACDYSRLNCPECGEPCGRYDKRERRWRHLDTMQLQTMILAQVPRIQCSKHGIKQVKVPWAEENSRMTAMFESLVIDWLRDAGSISAVANMMNLSWDEVNGVMQRAVKRGLLRRPEVLPVDICIDETSFQKRHEYVTVVSDRHGAVVKVLDGRKQEDLEAFFAQFPPEKRAAVQTVAMDMWPAFINAVVNQIPCGAEKVCFDKFHVAKHLGEAVDKVRKEENKLLLAAGDKQLKNTRYLWLSRLENLKPESRRQLEKLRQEKLKTAKAWSLKELAMDIWKYRVRDLAIDAWSQWLSWAMHSRLEPVKQVARMVREHLTGILNAMEHGVTNARAEGINSVIQWLKYAARGFRNRERFRNAIYFHLGALDLYPTGVSR